MAKDTKITIVIDAQGNPSLEKVNKSLGDQNKKVDKNTKSKKRNEQQGRRNQAVEKSLYQTTLNSTKGFSKQAREMGGSSGLVAAYATLAANVFAATAAFGALQRAAQFEQLSKGLSELGQQSGRTLSLMAEGLREVTGGAISAEEAMRAAALGVSGGFGGEQLEGLAKIAKGASITLGRSLPDAFDRLTRGAIKLEPEILDELGIMVRLDDAVENYAATIGKAGSALTQMERRQAFMNAILEQGEAKFGEIADAVEPDAYSQLGATFADLTKDIFQFFNQDVIFGFAGLNDVVKLLADNTTILFGIMTLFGSTIAGKMIPALGNAASAAAHFGEEQLALAAATEAQAAAQIAQRTALIGKGMEGTASKTYIQLAAGLEMSKDKMGDLMKMQKSLNASIVYQQGLIKTGTAQEAAAAKTKLALLQAEKVSLGELIALEQGKGAAAIASANATALANAQLIVSKEIIKLTNKEIGLGAAWKAISAATATYSAELAKNSAALASNNILIRLNGKAMIFLKAQLVKATAAFQIFKVAILNFIAPIGIAIVAVGAFIAIWRSFTVTEEVKNYNKGLEDMAKLFGEMEEKVNKFHQAQKQGKDLAASQLRAFEIQSGMITEINDKLREQIRLAEEANKSRKFGGDVRFGSKFDVIQGGKFAEAFAADSDQFMAPFMNFGKQLRESGIAEDANKTFLRNMFMVEGSPELNTFMQLMNSGIPNQAKFMKEKLQEIASDKTIKSAEELAEALQRGVGAAAAQFGALGPATKEFQESLKESNKAASQFLTGFAKKTKVDEFSRSINASVKSLDMMKTSAEEAEENVSQVVGRQLLNIGGQIASMLGPEFQEAQKAAKAAGRALEQAVTQEEIKAATREVEKTAEILSGFEPDVRVLNKSLLETQRLLQNTKTAIDANKKSLSFVKKAYKDIASLAGVTNKLERQNLQYQQDLSKAKIRQLKATFDNFKILDGTDKDGKDLFRLVSIQELMNLSLDEQRALIDKASLDQTQFNELRAGMLDISLRNLEIEKMQRSEQHQTNLEMSEAMLNRIKLHKQLLDSMHEERKLDVQIQNFKVKGKTGLNAKQEAEFKVQAAILAAKHAMATLDLEIAMIDSRRELQRIEMEILNQRAQIINKELELKGDDAIKLLDIEQAMDDLRKVGFLQKRALENNVDVLKKRVVVAMQEGAIAMKDALESGDIGVMEAMRGLSKMMKGAKDSELAVKDSKAAAEFYRMATTKGSAFVHDIPGEMQLKTLNTNMDKYFERLDANMKEDASKRADESISPYDMRHNPFDQRSDVKAEQDFRKAVAESELVRSERRAFNKASRENPTIVKGGLNMINEGGFTGEGTVNAGNDESAFGIEAQQQVMDFRTAIMATDIAMSALNQNLKDFGPEGEAMIGFRSGMIQMSNAMLMFREASGENELSDRLAATAAFIGGISQMIQNSAKGAVAQIDQLIEAEKKKDGKSKASLERIKQMEAKKTAIQKKAFEQNKKAQIAQTAINTASAAMQAYKDFSMPIGAIMAAMIVAMGAKQISMISKQQFQGGGDTAGAGVQSISVGKRDNKVDVSQRASAGELAFLRGDKGIGTTANKFQPMGGAGGLRKGYAEGGVLVGERGPEMIQPMSGFNVVPNDALGGKSVNAHFTINAIDARGVEEVLVEQQANIIGMIRSAANDYGEEFLESVEIDHLGGAPKSAGGIDY